MAKTDSSQTLLISLKGSLIKVIDNLIASIQGVVGKTRNIGNNRPGMMLRDFPNDFPGDSKEIANLIADAGVKFSMKVLRVKGSEIPSEKVATLQTQVGQLKELETYYRFIGRNRSLPGVLNFRTPNKFTGYTILEPFEKIKSVIKSVI